MAYPDRQQGVWLGPEVRTMRPHLIEAESSGHVPVDITSVRDAIPEYIVFDATTAITSTRSRYAQFGVEVLHDANARMARYVSSDYNQRVGFLPLKNHSQSPVLLERGSTCRLMRREGPPLTDDILLNLMAKGEIMAGGEEGTDWWPAKNRAGEIIGLGLYIQGPEEYLPPRERPLRIKGATTETFREELKKHQKVIKPGDKPGIRIGELNELYTSPAYMGFIDQTIDAVPPLGTWIANNWQINAPALYGGYPPKPWRIRTETRSTPAELHANGHRASRKAIVVSFYPVINPLPHAA